MAQLSFSAESSHPLADGLIFSNWLRTPSVQSHCLATFNPCMLIEVCVTNDSLDAVSGCPVQMSSQILLPHTPRFYRVLSFWSLLWVRNWAWPISSLGMLPTWGDLTVLHHQQRMTQPCWELSLANQLVRYAVHLRGPQCTQSEMAHDTTPFGLPRACRVFIAPCSKDIGSYHSLIAFTFHYLAFVSHDSFPYLSVSSHVTIYLLTSLPPLHLLLSSRCSIIAQPNRQVLLCIIRSLTLCSKRTSWSRQILSDLQWYPFLYLYPTSCGFPKR